MPSVAAILLIVCLTLSILCLLFGKVYVVNNYEIKVDCPKLDIRKPTIEAPFDEPKTTKNTPDNNEKVSVSGVVNKIDENEYYLV